MRKLILILGAALAVAACQPTDSVSTGNTNVAVANTTDAGCGVTSNTLVDEKLLFTAETAYNIPADAYVRAEATGKLPADIKATVRPLLIQAYEALKLARTAYKAGDGCSLKRYADLAVLLGSKAQLALPKQ